jgi:AmmeMemoRadiSam system protein A
VEIKNKKLILNLARDAIQAKLENRELKTGEIPDELKEERGTFVTLTIAGQLHGCIGHILPVQELYRDVIDNAQSAAFSDPRFPPLTKEEFKKVKIEVSILDLPQKFNYKSPDELIARLAQDKPGVILRKGPHQATFLPQVWEELPDAKEFLTHLCLKAGLDPEDWEEKTEISIYNVEKIEED